MYTKASEASDKLHQIALSLVTHREPALAQMHFNECIQIVTKLLHMVSATVQQSDYSSGLVS